MPKNREDWASHHELRYQVSISLHSPPRIKPPWVAPTREFWNVCYEVKCLDEGWAKRCRRGPPSLKVWEKYYHLYKYTDAKLVALRLEGKVNHDWDEWLRVSNRKEG